MAYTSVKEVQSELSLVEEVINIDADDYKSTCHLLSEINSTTQLPTKSRPLITDIASILYSSGTTGLPKGVKVTHKNYIYLMEFYRRNDSLRFPENTVASGLLPMTHCYGFFTVLFGLIQGHTCILTRRFSKINLLNDIQKYQINILYLVPTIVLYLLKNPLVFNYDLSCVKSIVSGGACIKKEMEQLLKMRIKSSKFVQIYGLTETTGACIVHSGNMKPEAIGKLIPGMQAKVIDINDGTPLGPFESGELCVKGVVLMDGYCQVGNNQIPGTDEDGWFHTGDVAHYDNDHDFYVVDRIKEIIKYKSYQVSPTEIETFLLKLEAIEEAAVVGVPEEEAGELPRAYVVKKKGFENLTASDIEQLVADNLSSPKRLRGGVVFVEDIPKTPTGKVNRKELKNWATADVKI